MHATPRPCPAARPSGHRCSVTALPHAPRAGLVPPHAVRSRTLPAHGPGVVGTSTSAGAGGGDAHRSCRPVRRRAPRSSDRLARLALALTAVVLFAVSVAVVGWRAGLEPAPLDPADARACAVFSSLDAPGAPVPADAAATRAGLAVASGHAPPGSAVAGALAELSRQVADPDTSPAAMARLQAALRGVRDACGPAA